MTITTHLLQPQSNDPLEQIFQVGKMGELHSISDYLYTRAGQILKCEIYCRTGSIGVLYLSEVGNELDILIKSGTL